MLLKIKPLPPQPHSTKFLSTSVHTTAVSNSTSCLMMLCFKMLNANMVAGKERRKICMFTLVFLNQWSLPFMETFNLLKYEYDNKFKALINQNIVSDTAHLVACSRDDACLLRPRSPAKRCHLFSVLLRRFDCVIATHCKKHCSLFHVSLRKSTSHNNLFILSITTSCCTVPKHCWTATPTNMCSKRISSETNTPEINHLP